MENQTKTLIPWHSQSPEEVMDSFSVGHDGLSPRVAEERLDEYGRNELPKKKPRAALNIFLAQFTSALMLILIAAAAISAALFEWLDFTVIMLVIVLNAILGFVEEYRANRALEALKSYLPRTAKVRRGGEIMIIPAEEVVPGDVMILSQGDRVTADARIIVDSSLEVNEAALTGESASVKKGTEAVALEKEVSDRASMLFAGTTIAVGTVEGLVVGTGLNTEFGRIAKLVVEVKDKKTPLQEQLITFSKLIGGGILFLAVIIFVVGLVVGLELVEMLQISVAITVAAIPEGLVVAVTAILAIGMQRILKKKALVRSLVAAETLGSVNVICVDKTGTLTTGKMTVKEIRINEEIFAEFDDHQPELDEIYRAILFTNYSIVEYGEGEDFKVFGSPTESALLEFLLKHQVEDVRSAARVIAELPFDSKNKYSARLIGRGQVGELYVLGAPDILLPNLDLSDRQRLKLVETFEAMTERGLRVLMATKRSNVKEKKITTASIRDLEVIGLIGLQDPLREEAAQTLEIAKGAGLRTVMITGDHPETALAIAREVGLDVTHQTILTGQELDEMSDDELYDLLPSTHVFARVMPRHKLRIVHLWQRRGASVAMTGDGVNDAPALKAADIGIALGSGTEVAKEAADMVLLDDNFKTIIDAIREGRIIFDNLRKIIVYLLSGAFTEILLVLGALVFFLPLPILPAQILWINLVTDGLPSMALIFEPGEKKIMKEPPRKKTDPILNTEMKVLIFVVGIIADLILFAIFFYLLNNNFELNEIRTFIFVALGLNSLMYVFAVRKFRTSVFRANPFENKILLLGVLGGFILLILPLAFAPLRNLFEFTALSVVEWGVLILLAILQLILIEIVKEFYNRKRNLKLV